ncbi:MAG: cysteine desulfurase [Lachnospiraceae bacterium]|nr:cysteine desulfurase [Lachnospiraceae bacterium]
MNEIYLDNSATTRAFPEVAELMSKILVSDYGNPSSMHFKGVEAEHYIKEAKARIAKTLKVEEKEILFTSCGTESDNIALIGTALANHRAGKHIITTCIEHPAILETCAFLEEQGYEITYLPVDAAGQASLSALEDAIRPDTILVSMMHTNNEIGALQPIEEAGALIKRKNPNTLFHVDAVQGYGKARIYPKKMNIDMLSVSGHKIHATKGIGFLYMKDKIKVRPILFGGGQQKGMRPGTENVAAIAGLGLAAQMVYANFDEDIERMYALRDEFVAKLRELPEVTVNGKDGRESAPHVVSASIAGIRAEVLLHALEDKGICVSSGSACASNHPQLSGTLQAIGVKRELLDSTIRFSFSVFTTKEELDVTIQALEELLPQLRRFTRR